MTTDSANPTDRVGDLPVRQDARLQLALFIILPVLAVGVMLLPRWPGLIDLPAHIARYHVQLDLASSPLLQPYYRIDWQFIPNLAMDLLIYPLAKAFGLDFGVRVGVALIPATMIIGLLALAKAAHRHIPPTSLIALPCAFGYPLVFGFVNFCLTAGLAMIAAAVWLKLTLGHRHRLRLLFGLIVSPILFTAHLAGWGLFGLTSFGMVVAANRDDGFGKAIVAALLATAPLAWPLIVMILPGSGEVGPSSGWPDLGNVSRHMIGILRERSAMVDIASAAVLFLTALLPIVAPRRFAFEPLLLIPAILVWVAVLAIPAVLAGSAFANVRLIPVALGLTILAVRPTRPLPLAAMTIAVGFVVFRLGVTANALLNFDATAQRQLAGLDRIEPGSKVLAFKMHSCLRHWAPPRSQNLSLLATVRRDALTNGHFTVSGSQLLQVTYAPAQALMNLGRNTVMSEICSRWAQPVLEDALAKAPLSAFDYVWLLDVPERRLPNDKRLELLWRDQGSAIYKIARSDLDERKTSYVPG